MRQRPSSRLLIVDPERRLLLFKFQFRRGPLTGQAYWATPGGALDQGESYEEAACRELFEEVGLRIDHPGPQVARREAVFPLTDGGLVAADERYFLVRAQRPEVSRQGWSQLEREVMTEHRWWTMSEIRSADEQVWPEELVEMLVGAGVW